MQSTEASNSASKFERFVVLTFRAADGVSPEAGYDIRDILNQLNPEGWWFLNPGSFVVCFSSDRSGQARAAECRAAIERLCLAHESLSGAKFGQAEGDLLASFEPHGHLSTMPIGAAMSEAWRHDG